MARRAAADALAAQTAEWIVRLSADDACERETARREFEAWKRADPAHAAASAELEQFVQQVQSLRDQPPDDTSGNAPDDTAGRQDAAHRHAARAALHAVVGQPMERTGAPQRPARTRRIGRLAALMLALLLPVALALRAYPPALMLADLRTATGEQHSATLADGTRLTLSTATALNIDYDERQRYVKLLRGEIHLDVASDAARPFTVETTHGRIRALGTRFIVRRGAGYTELLMLESRTAVTPAQGSGADATRTVETGQSVRLSAAGFEQPRPIDAGTVEDAFRYRRLVVQDQPLSSVLDELARHRRGLIRFDRKALQDIRVSAVLPLDDTGRALRLLDSSFPQLRIRTVTPLLVLVDLVG